MLTLTSTIDQLPKITKPQIAALKKLGILNIENLLFYFPFRYLDFSQNKKIKDLIEKPKKPISSYAVTGLYQFPPDVYDKIGNLTKSQRGELEVTDLNKIFLSEGRLNYKIVTIPWIDAGTIDSLYRAQSMVRKYSSNKSHLK